MLHTVVYQGRMSLGIARRTTAAIGLLGLLVLGVAAAPATADAEDPSDAEWYALADEAVAEVEATDWAALSAQDGCKLVELEITEVVDPELNEALGAPEDLAVPVVEREEMCAGLDSSLVFDGGERTDGGMGTMVSRGSDCSSTSGPGRLCIARSGNYVSTSFRYSGSGSIKAYLRLYDISTSASGCPTGSTIATGSTSSYSYGTQRSLTVYSPSYDAYSSYIWRYVGLGHYTAWGSACGIF